LRIHAAALRQRLRDVSTHRIGRFGQEALCCAGQPRELLRERMQLRRLRMVLREVAQKDAFALARCMLGGA
jgi:hypothetical protein